MNELALFAGAGGGLLATKWLLGWRTACYVENATYPVEVLKARIRDGLLDDAPIWDDARTFDGRPWCGCVDIVTAGFPCQPFSVAGQQLAERDERNLWPDTIRIIREVRPGWCLLENVPGLLAGSHGYFGTILRELAESGYDVRWRVLSAAEVGAPHIRDRLWVVAVRNGDVANSQGVGWRDGNTSDIGEANGASDTSRDRREILADAGCTGRQQESRAAYGDEGAGAVQWTEIKRNERGWKALPKTEWWNVEPNMGRVADGVAARVERLRAIGNGQVSCVASAVWRLLSEMD